MEIPYGVVNIGPLVFYGGSCLKSVTFPDSVTNISDGAFCGCSELGKAVIPHAVKSIGESAFANCSKVSSVIIGSGVTRIGSHAFGDCSVLTNVIICSALEPLTTGGMYDGCPERLVTSVPSTWATAVSTWQDRGVVKINNLGSIIQFWVYDGTYRTIGGSLEIPYAPLGGDHEGIVVLNGAHSFSSSTSGTYTWQPLATGMHTLGFYSYWNDFSVVVHVSDLDFFVQPEPNPPMAQDPNVSITPPTRNFGANGGGNSILVSGSSATWTAAASDPWIALNTTTGNVGYPVAYTVSENTNVEQRTGYVYVSGWVHTVTQDGVGGTISPENREFEHHGGSGTIAVSAANKMVWQARPNVDWLSVSPTSGAGEGSVTYQVAPYNEVATRQGTLTVAGNTFTVFQYGRRMKLDSYSVTKDYEAHVIPITVNALAITQWSVTPNDSWISVVDAGNGHGGDLVSIAIAENPSYRARTGTVTIGTETFTITQQGRPTAALSFNGQFDGARGGRERDDFRDGNARSAVDGDERRELAHCVCCHRDGRG